MLNIKLTVEYDGSDFSGWQVQPDQRTVQGEIEKALRTLTHRKIRIIGAGRTDAGVHALGQAVNFKCQDNLPLSAFEKGLDGLLPEDIHIIAAEEAVKSFNARRDAVSRVYRYVLSRKPRAVGRQYAWYPGMKFLLEPMEYASKFLLGEHDFTSFCKSDGEHENFVSRVLKIKWSVREEEIHFEITAVRFFHKMIRIIVGTLLEVGRGKISPENFREILAARDRTQAGPTVPPQGLFLVKVNY